ncbi:MAG TPA: ABC transporter substrate-binding protein [Streptosporangiaceae bacterium]|nr:ABC transporter substrate-binding protein [Streptosporangiaceae bacterium]
MRKKTTLAAIMCAAGALVLAACGSSPSTPAKTSSTSSTLVMESSPSGPVSKDFNPFSSTSADNILGATNMIYDPLMQFDLLKSPATTYPWLATKYAWSNGGKTITFTLRSGVKFTNGEAFNASVAAWEYNLIKDNAAINTNGLPYAGATAPNATTLVINFKQPVYTLLYYIANTPMIPENVWSKVGNPATYADTDPIGTGPYTLSSFTPQAVILTANTHYWQGAPHVTKLEFPAYDSNTSANLALEQDQLDWAGNFVQNIKTAWVGKDPATNKFWDFGLQTETLIPNLTKFPLNDLAVREAISYGVNRTTISNVGEDYQQPPVQGPGSLTGITLPLDQSYVTSATSGYVASYDPAKAKQILEADGWKMGSNGYFQKGGKTLSFSITDPSAYTDFITDDQIMASELKSVGMDVTVNGTSVQAWTTDLQTGNFQAIAHWGNGGPTPYYLYDNWLDTNLTAPVGKVATGDYERFYSTQAESDLKQFAGTSDTATQLSDVVSMEKIVATQLPVIPLFYGVAWFEYNTSKFTGWPSPANPYAPGEPSGPFNEITVLHLRPVK